MTPPDRLIERVLSWQAASVGGDAGQQRLPEADIQWTSVIQWALGRGAAESTAGLQDASRALVAARLLGLHSDPYRLLGLPPGSHAREIKDRYRLLIRLVHPDFASRADEWPSEAAVRINKAYDLLSDPVARATLDRELAERVAGPISSRTPLAPARKSPRPAAARFNRRAVGLGFGATGVVVALVIWGQVPPEPDHVVQLESAVRSPPGVAGASDSTAPAKKAATATLASVRAGSPSPPTSPTLPLSQAMGPMGVAPPVPQLPGSASPGRPSGPAAVAEGSRAVAPSPLGPSVAAVGARAPEPAALAISASPPLPAGPKAASTPPSAAAAPPIPSLSAAMTSSAPTAVPVPLVNRPQVSPVSLAQTPAAADVPTLGDVHPMLMRLIDAMGAGEGDSALAVLPRSARQLPSAQAWARRFEELAGGRPPARVNGLRLQASARDGRLWVRGSVKVQSSEGAPAQDLPIHAEFVRRQGAPEWAYLGL